MRTITTTQTVFTFDELTDTAKQTAISELYDINVGFEWGEYVYEDADNIGLKITSFDIDRGSFCKGSFILAACEVVANIFRDHGDQCETHKTATQFMEEWQPVFDRYMDEDDELYESRELEDELQEMEEEFLKSLCEDYRIMLQKEYEYLTSDEAIQETIEANNIEFTEDGKPA